MEKQFARTGRRVEVRYGVETASAAPGSRFC
jgi:hypothetical protein